MSDKVGVTATPLVQEEGGGSSNSVTLIIIIAVIGSAFVIGVVVSVFKCLKASRSRASLGRLDQHTLPRTIVTRRGDDPILSAQIVYMQDISQGTRGSLAHQAIVVDDLVTVNAMSWAQRMMSGNGVEKSQGSVHETTPVKEAIYVQQPDGKHILAVSQRFRDSMIQVKPEDLGIQTVGLASRLERSSSVGASISSTPTSHGIIPLFGTHSHQKDDGEEKQEGTRKRKKKRRKGTVKYDAWCQANLDMRRL